MDRGHPDCPVAHVERLTLHVEPQQPPFRDFRLSAVATHVRHSQDDEGGMAKVGAFRG